MASTLDIPPIAVIGAGSWGTALAMHIAGTGRKVYLWGHEPEQMTALAADRSNEQFLPGLTFPDSLEVLVDLSELPASCRKFLVVVPSHAFRQVLRVLLQLPASPTIIAWGTKGLEKGTSLFMSNIADEELPAEIQTSAISGPSFAGEVARGMPTAITVASSNNETAAEVASWLHHHQFRAYTQEDLIGVQVGGALKNVMAIAAGISDGLGFGANARAALITRGLAEITRLGIRAGGQMETFMGLAGMGDLVLTCTDNQSRNRRVGLGLGEGASLEQTMQKIGQEAEGVQSAAAAWELSRKLDVAMPITEQVYNVIYKDLPALQAVENLLHRDPKHE
ncbi:MAG: NAD(P)H-dependent glycerol-3-phosphate dehydrogenase [Gammaproteobacteria bacterium]|nr:NAD(P)H-dependent glycerol-3-phosphate dehydrogenase [Gammaproteobacteria bacterium]MDX2487595.1 NAD(P)H-dependent glycerol-3-phosphate dehydrogenase [Gammaproteobacteria bacterium]